MIASVIRCVDKRATRPLQGKGMSRLILENGTGSTYEGLDVELDDVFVGPTGNHRYGPS